MTTSSIELDLTGLQCPLPVLKTQKKLKDLAPGDQLLVKTTDPVSTVDIPHFCHTEGHQIVEQVIDGDIICFLIEKQA